MLEGGENLCLRPPSRMIQLSLRLQMMAFTVTCFSYFKGRFAAFRADLTMSIFGMCVSRVPGREPVEPSMRMVQVNVDGCIPAAMSLASHSGRLGLGR